MATVRGAELLDIIVDGGKSAKSLSRPGLQRLIALVNGSKVQAVIVAKLDRLTRNVKDLCGLLEPFEKRKVALISVAEALDTGSAAGRLVITIMGAVSQRERKAIGERAMLCGTNVATGCAFTLNSCGRRTRRGTEWRLDSVAR